MHSPELHPHDLTQSHMKPVGQLALTLAQDSVLILGFEEMDSHRLISVLGCLHSKEGGSLAFSDTQ